MTAVKNDKQKPDLSILPLSFLTEVAKAMSYGANKYGRDNYKQGMEVTRFLSAALRHIYQYLEGEDIDSESGNLHLGHAAASILMAIETARLGTLKDNRGKQKRIELLSDQEVS